MRKRDIVPVPESLLRRMANIMGEQSASALALADIERRRADGQDPFCVRDGEMLIVIGGAA